MSNTRVVKIICEEYQSYGRTRCVAMTLNSRGHRSGGCDIIGKVADAVKECLTPKEHERDDIEIVQTHQQSTWRTK